MPCLTNPVTVALVGMMLLLLQHQSAFVLGFVVPTTKETSRLMRSSAFRLLAAKKNKKNPNRTYDVIPELDPTDPQYQVSKEFPPNKESSWPFPIHQDGWILAHDTLRFEMKNLRSAFETVLDRERQRDNEDDEGNNRTRLDDWVVEYLQDVWKVHRELVYVHHTDEDDIMVPVFRERFIWPEKLEADHVEVENSLKKLDTMFANDLQPGPFDFITNFFEGKEELSASERLAIVVEEYIKYEDILKPHLLEEERTMLPLQRAYMAPEDLVEMNGKIVEGAPPTVLGSVIHCTAGKEGFKEIMKQDGMPEDAFEGAWETVFAPGYDNYLKIFVNKLDALKEGKEIPVLKEREVAATVQKN